MNINQIKAFLSDKPQHLGSENSIQNQLRKTGLDQAISGQNNQVLQRDDQLSFSLSLGVRVYSNSLNSTLEIDRQKPNLSTTQPVSSEVSTFDFEKIAKNVLNFVGGAIKNAQNRGADAGELSRLFEQASSGVLRGIKLAEQDLAGFMNEEITRGVSQSKSLIEDGIANLKRDIFNPDILESKKSSQSTVNTIIGSTVKQESGELSITTRDGDRVSITFKDLEKFEFSQEQIKQYSQKKPQDEVVDVLQPFKSDSVSAVTTAPSKLTLEANTEDKFDSNVEQVKDSLSGVVLTEQKVVFFQESAFSFSVQGELGQDELKAIGQLVSDANELAEEFFNGDIETAFNQALELGFDEQELSSFALQLTKVENTQVIKAYETVSRFDQDSVDSHPAKAVKPVADYLNKLLNVLDGSRQQLEDNKSYENIINELINRLGEDVATPDLISAINRFNVFNQKLVDNLPVGYQPKNQSSSI
jgi:hypothetical protein